MSKFKVGDVVRYRDDYVRGGIGRIDSLDHEEGIGVRVEEQDLEWAYYGENSSVRYFAPEFLEPVADSDAASSNDTTTDTDLDAIIAKLERIKALRTELGL
ncbi:MAG: hypothetical protein H5U22_06660 [Rhizobium sp.]|nr:hypothetical protein [Rhizobium sp.]